MKHVNMKKIWKNIWRNIWKIWRNMCKIWRNIPHYLEKLRDLPLYIGFGTWKNSEPFFPPSIGSGTWKYFELSPYITSCPLWSIWNLEKLSVYRLWDREERGTTKRSASRRLNKNPERCESARHDKLPSFFCFAIKYTFPLLWWEKPQKEAISLDQGHWWQHG